MRLAMHAQADLIVRHMLVEHLHRHDRLALTITRAEHRAESSPSELLQHFVAVAEHGSGPDGSSLSLLLHPLERSAKGGRRGTLAHSLERTTFLPQLRPRP